MTNDTLISEGVTLVEEMVPVLGRFIIQKLDPTCDVAGATTALSAVVGDFAKLGTALATKTGTTTSA